MALYELTRAAASDFETIFEYGIDQFGLEQAVDYQNRLKHHFSVLASHPEQYPAVDHIREGYRRSIHESHAIYFRIEDHGVLIVRVLGRQRVENAF